MRLGLLCLASSSLIAACAGGAADDGTTWSVSHTEANGALLSVWGSAPDDVWAAGGQADRGLILHNDGAGWSPVAIDAPAMLTWVYGFTAEDIYAVGNQGLAFHYDGSAWTRIDTGTDLPLYGVWGSSGDDVWIVGGDPSVATGAAVVLRGSGEAFERVAVPAELAPNALYKAYGFAADDFIAVGTGGTVLRFSGGDWWREPTPTEEPLFSLWGRGADDVYAVGGTASGELLHYDGATWTRAHEAVQDGLSGVFTTDDSPAIAVGMYSYVLEVEPDGSDVEPEMPALDPVPFLHGVWGDGAGTTYAAGGDLFRYPDAMTGVILTRR